MKSWRARTRNWREWKARGNRARRRAASTKNTGAFEERLAEVETERDELARAKAAFEERLVHLETERDELANKEAESLSAAYGSRIAEFEKEIAEMRSMEEKILGEMSAMADEKNAVIARLTEELDAVKAKGASDAQGRVGELNAALSQAQHEAATMRAAVEEARATAAATDDLRARLTQAEADAATALEVQKELTAKLNESNARARRFCQGTERAAVDAAATLFGVSPKTENAVRQFDNHRRRIGRPRRIPVEIHAYLEGFSRHGRVRKRFQPAMEFCDTAFIRFFRVMRTQPSLRFAALSYWAFLHAWLFYHAFLAY